MKQEQEVFPDADAWVAAMVPLTRQFNSARQKPPKSEYCVFAALDLSNMAELGAERSVGVSSAKRASPEPEELLC